MQTKTLILDAINRLTVLETVNIKASFVALDQG